MEVPHAGDATGEEVMEVMYPRCAGLDVHKETVVACVRIVEGGEVSRVSSRARHGIVRPARRVN